LRLVSKRRNIHRSASAILIAGLLLGCLPEKRESPYVARVNQVYLTRQDIEAVTDSTGDVRSQTREYVNNWITAELLYQEALRRGLVGTDELRKQLDEAKKHLAIGALLDNELYNEESEQVGEDEITATYNSSGDAFLLREDVVQISFALFADRDVANSFRTKILEGSSWNDAVAQIQADSLPGRQLLQVANHQYFSKGTLFPDELWKLSRTLPKDEVSFVAKTSVGYHVLIVHSVKRQGEMPDLDYVRNEIRDRILIAKRRVKYENLLANLRSKNSIEVFAEVVDTTSSPTE